MTPLILHYAPDNASLIIRLVLEEAAVPYETRLVDRSRDAQTSKAYLKLHPGGTIPVLETPHGPLFETAAILLWITERTGRMAPPPGSPERGDFLKWLMFLSNTVQMPMRLAFYPARFAGPDPDTQSTLAARMQVELTRSFAALDAACGSGWIGGPEVSALDYYIACFLRWVQLYPVDVPRWFDVGAVPALAALARRLEDRPATEAARLAEGLGPAPFTAPRLADPPEGSAT